MRITSIATVIVGAALSIDLSSAFAFPAIKSSTKATNTATSSATRNPTFLQLSSSNEESESVPGSPPKMSPDEEMKVQWDLFTKHHAKGKWRGTWTSYNYMGDVLDETTASVNLLLNDQTNPNAPTVEHTHDIVMSKISSDCETCFDSEDVQTIPIGSYTPGNLKQYRCASAAMCAGPTLMRSGAMSTELVLSHGNGRVRVVYQHAPVWEQGIEPGSCPPHALKLFRTMISREVLDADVPPSFQSEEKNVPLRGDPRFFRPVPPFQWHKKWAGSSWTWGEQTGDRGWAVDDLDEADAWHGRPTGDTSDVWAMRLPGGILLQCPRVITTGRAGLCRLAWLPEDDAPVGSASDGDTAKLLRVEASVMALEPVIDEENDVMLGFYPPELGSLRCDVLAKYGELEDVSIMDKLKSMGEMGNKGGGELDPIREFVGGNDGGSASSSSKSSSTKGDGDDDEDDDDEPLDDSGLDAIRNALKL